MQDSLAYFGDRRTDKSVGKSFQGVETPSQVSVMFSHYYLFPHLIENIVSSEPGTLLCTSE